MIVEEEDSLDLLDNKTSVNNDIEDKPKKSRNLEIKTNQKRCRNNFRVGNRLL